MGKLVMAISAAVTAFILALTAAAVYAYRSMSTPTTVAQQPVSQVGAPLQLAALPTAAPTDVPNVSPQDAAAIAAKYLNRTDLYSVELADQQGTQTYKVTFTSGDVVYVGLKGQVMAAVAPSPVTTTIITTGGGSSGGRHSGGGGGGGGGGEGEHEGGDN
jgi:uncharacterized membrane protein YgcG